jgi:DNA-binding transcriptional MerR regulator/quercetin dioxygenase-like cupin family protein
MAYSVKQVAAMSGVSVRTLHFYDETGLLKPAFQAANGYRFYEEPQLLALQQILFYRELGFKLKEIREIAGRKDIERAAALQAHREVLEENLTRTRILLETIGKTIAHLRGVTVMKNEDLFLGFSVAAGEGRFDEHIRLGGEPSDCKVSSQDTAGALCVFEFTGTVGGPRHLHNCQDEWIYVVDGDILVQAGADERHLSAGESMFLPRKVGHVWASLSDKPGKIVNVYQPAGKMEEFFREVGKYGETPIHENLKIEELQQLFEDHGMDLLGPPLTGQWSVDNLGRAINSA